VVKDMPIFKKVTMQYHFKNFPPGGTPDVILFARSDIIFELNFDREEATVIHKIDKICDLQPSFFKTNPD
jgi:hypothetical protein